MHPQQPMSNQQLFGNALVEYINRTGGMSRLHRVLFDTMSYSGWNNNEFYKLIGSTSEFYEYLVNVDRMAPDFAIGKAVEVCCAAAMAVAVSRTPLVNVMDYNEGRLYNDSMATLKRADEAMNAYSAQVQQPAYQPGRAAMYARSNVAPTQPAYANQMPTSQPTVTRRPVPGNFTPSYQQPNRQNTADVQRNELYRSAKPSKPISTMPQVPLGSVDNRNPRYDRSRDAIPPAVSVPVTDDDIKDAARTTEIQKMKYENHRLAPVTVAKVTDRTANNLDEFLGVLANNERFDITAAGPDTEQNLDQYVIGLPDTFAAVGLDMAILKAKGILGDTIRTAKNVIMEFEYTNISTLYYTTEAEISAAIVNCPMIGRIAKAKDYAEAHAVMKDYLANRPASKDLYSIADRIMAEINNRLTEAVNRNMAFVLAVGERIDDFAADWDDLLALLNKNYVDFEDDLRTNVKQVIERCCMVGVLDSSSNDFADINQFMHGALADSICVMDLTSVTLLPLMSTELDLAVSDDMSLVSIEKLPELHKALEGVVERLEFSYMYYRRIYLVTEDGVLIEIIPTMIPTGNDIGTKFAIRLVDRH